jgi:hypothetical protein
VKLEEVTAAMAALREREIPPRYILCGSRKWKEILQLCDLDPDSPSGTLTLESAMQSDRRGPLPGENLASMLFGLHIVVSEYLPPDFFEVLPDPVWGSARARTFRVRFPESNPS